MQSISINASIFEISFRDSICASINWYNAERFQLNAILFSASFAELFEFQERLDSLSRRKNWMWVLQSFVHVSELTRTKTRFVRLHQTGLIHIHALRTRTYMQAVHRALVAREYRWCILKLCHLGYLTLYSRSIYRGYEYLFLLLLLLLLLLFSLKVLLTG